MPKRKLTELQHEAMKRPASSSASQAPESEPPECLAKYLLTEWGRGWMTAAELQRLAHHAFTDMQRMGKTKKDYPALWALAKLCNCGKYLKTNYVVRSAISLPLKDSGPAGYKEVNQMLFLNFAIILL